MSVRERLPFGIKQLYAAVPAQPDRLNFRNGIKPTRKLRRRHIAADS